MLDINQAQGVIGRKLLDGEGDEIGEIGQVYLDDRSGRPEWATVRTGLFGTRESFVPLAEAGLTDGGVTVPYARDKVIDAPSIDDAGHLSGAEEQELYSYYGISATTDGSGDADDAMTRSEEQLNVGTEQVASGRARLRKYVVTENVTQTVPVSHEEVRLEREPITDATRGDTLDGPDIGEEEHEVTLREERVVVSKEAVPVERVRLGTDTVTEEQQVDEEVRKERIELDDSELPSERRGDRS